MIEALKLSKSWPIWGWLRRLVGICFPKTPEVAKPLRPGTIEMYCDKFGLDGTAVRHGRLMEIADNIRHGANLGLPWFMCIDPQTVQSMTALAQAQGIDVTELIQQIKVLEE